MSYVVLARKWRPQTFSDLVGQDHVATTLANSIALGRIAHAFLFTGVRGVGKTTSARILAKALNCEKGPTAEPCLTCSPCVDIMNGADLDVIEMDAASNRGINDIRELQQTLAYRPARDRFKIFIVDEVHMLTNEAWNAFLKTLEEPPPHVKFIFATTDVHKVPVTILSRCQRYDFKLIAAPAVAARVKHVLAAEGIEAEEGAVKLVSREAAGSMRDAMSLLDQVIAWGGPGEKITTEGATRVLGVADRSILHRLATAVVRGEAGAAIEVVGELAESGYDIPHVARDFLSHLRDLVIAKVAPEGRGLADVPEDERADLRALAAEVSTEDLSRLHLGLSRAFEEVAHGVSPRASFEMVLVRLARRPPLVPIDELLRRLGELERRVGGATPPSGGGSGGGGGGGGGREAPRRDDAPPRREEPTRPSARQAPVASSTRAEDHAPEPPGPSSLGPSSLGPSSLGPPSGGAPVPASAPASPGLPSPASPSPRPPVSREAPRELHGTPPPTLADDDPALVAYRDIVSEVHARQPALASVLEHGALVEASPARLVIGFEHGSFLAGQLQAAGPRAAVLEAAQARLGPDVTFEVVSVAREATGGTLAKRAAEALRMRVADAEREVREHPLVRAAVEVLGAELREVHLAPELANAASWDRRS